MKKIIMITISILLMLTGVFGSVMMTEIREESSTYENFIESFTESRLICYVPKEKTTTYENFLKYYMKGNVYKY